MASLLFRKNQFLLDDEEMAFLSADIDPLTNDGDSGINHFCNVRSRIQEFAL